MEKTAVICDAGPLIAITCSDGLKWLRGLFERVALTPTVANEVLVEGKPGVADIREAIESGWLCLLPEDPPDLGSLIKYNLDAGESTSIAVAWYLKPDCLLIVDETAARKAAKDLGVPVIGTAGLLIQAKNEGLVASCGEELAKMMENGFYISQALTEAVLSRAAETIEMSPRLKKHFP